MREFILGGQRSGKSRRAEDAARQWLAASGAHKAVLIATAQAHDDEMRERIARHQADRAVRLPQMQLVQEPLDLAQAIAAHSHSATLVVVDCLTLWLTNCMMPMECVNSEEKTPPADLLVQFMAPFLAAIEAAKGPLVVVSNEIGQGVVPMGREVRAFVDGLGRLHQETAQRCERVTWMVAGCPVHVKGAAP
jgi:adenosylcobinamide kinase / adenosylcobinamide-phosphate guanylyltransferase